MEVQTAPEATSLELPRDFRPCSGTPQGQRAKGLSTGGRSHFPESWICQVPNPRSDAVGCFAVEAGEEEEEVLAVEALGAGEDSLRWSVGLAAAAAAAGPLP